MNTKGQVIFYSFMIAICVLILALAFAPIMKQFVDDARGDMDCTNAPDLTKFDQLACLAVDVQIFYFIGALIFMCGSIIAARVVFE